MDTMTLFNATVGSAALAAAFRLGLLDELKERDQVDVAAYCARHDLDLRAVDALAAALHQVDVAEFEPSERILRRGRLFADAFAEKGYFYWLIAGYGPMLQGLGQLVRNGDAGRAWRARDPAAIAVAARDYGAAFVDPTFRELLDDRPFDSVADIGCGAAGRLVRLARERPDLRCVGIELDERVAGLAEEAVRAAGLEQRIEILQGDIREISSIPACRNVDVLFSFFMAHDLWPRAACIAALRRIRELFPSAERFLLCDTYRSDALLSNELPIFTLGFELTHAVLRQHVPSDLEWREVFAEAGWECEGQRPIDIPYSAIFDLRPRK